MATIYSNLKKDVKISFIVRLDMELDCSDYEECLGYRFLDDVKTYELSKEEIMELINEQLEVPKGWEVEDIEIEDLYE